MPFVNAKITMAVSEAQKDLLQAELTDFVVTALGKPKKFVMVNIEAAQDIWFAGEKMELGAFVSVRLMGNATKEAYSELTKKICEFLKNELSIPGDSVYVTFHPVEYWGWDGEIL